MELAAGEKGLAEAKIRSYIPRGSTVTINTFNCGDATQPHTQKMQTDYLISVRRRDFIIINKKRKPYKSVDFPDPGWPQSKIESDDYTNCYWCSWYIGLLKVLDDLEISGREETIETILLRTVWILRKVLETSADILPLKLQWQTLS